MVLRLMVVLTLLGRRIKHEKTKSNCEVVDRRPYGQVYN